MIKTSRQLKDLIRNLSAKKKTEPLVLMRNYMMERFIERLSKSKHKDQLILKGGMLITAMVGLDTRTTMDLDTTLTLHTTKVVGFLFQPLLRFGKPTRLT